MDSQKWGSFSVQKCNFKPKFANYIKIRPTAKFVNFSKCENLQFLRKIWYESGKKCVIWCGLRKKRGLGCKIYVKKGVYWQSLDIHRHIGVPSPPPRLKREKKYRFKMATKWPIFLSRHISISAKIEKKNLSQRNFFNEIWLIIGDHK